MGVPQAASTYVDWPRADGGRFPLSLREER